MGLKNNLDQNQIAFKCYKFIEQKVEIKSVVKTRCAYSSNVLVENKYNKYLIQRNDIPFSKDGLGYTKRIRFGFNTVNGDPEMIDQYIIFINATLC